MKYEAKTKEAAVNAIKEGKSITDVSAEMNIPVSTLKGWIKNESKQEEAPKQDEPANDEPKQDEAQAQDAPADNESKSETPKDIPSSEKKEWMVVPVINFDKKLVVKQGSKIVEIKYSVPEKLPPIGKEARQYDEYMAGTMDTLEKLCLEWNAARSFSDPVTTPLGKDIDQLCKLYNEASCIKAMKVCYEDEEETLMHAVRIQVYTTIKATARTPKNGSFEERKVTEVSRRIPLERLHNTIDGGIGQNKSWIYTAQMVNKMFCAVVIKALSKDNKKIADIWRDMGGYTLDQAAKALENGENPVSNTKLLKALRLVTEQALGEEFARKFLSCDVRKLILTWSKEYKKDSTGLTIDAATHKKFIDLLLVTWYRILTDKEYGVFYK